MVHLDDLYEGWSGLPTVDAQLEGLLRPLAEGLAGGYRRWDWPGDRWAETVTVEPGPLLVLEGVGSGAGRCADLHTVLAWVEAPHDLRLRRGLDRDGDAFAPHWERWAAAEAELFARSAPASGPTSSSTAATAPAPAETARVFSETALVSSETALVSRETALVFSETALVCTHAPSRHTHAPSRRTHAPSRRHTRRLGVA